MSLDAIPAGVRVLIDALVLAVESVDFTNAAELQRTHGLLTNDSLNLAAGLRNGVNLLATADPQFDSIPGITVFKTRPRSCTHTRASDA
jgi:predicted nucleic acid-binding protein